MLCRENDSFVVTNPHSYSRNTSVNDDQPSIAWLLEKHRHLQSQIHMVTDLLCKKQEEIKSIKQTAASLSNPLSQLKNTIGRDPDANSYPVKFQALLKILKDLKNFSCSGVIDDDVLREFVAYLKLAYPQVLIVDVEHTRLLTYGTEEDVRKILNRHIVENYVDMVFVLKSSKQYSLLAYNSDNSTFFHYRLNGLENEELAEQLVLRMRHYVDVEQLLHVSPNFTPYTESSLYVIENIIKVIWNGLDDRLSKPISVDEFQKLPSHPDELNVVVTNNYVINKIKSITDLAVSDHESSGSVNVMSE